MTFFATLALTVGVNILASVFGPKNNVVTRGARLKDLRVPSAAYGVPIPIIEGRYRIPTNIIWSTGIQEEETRKVTGGKGGGGTQTDISYTYFADFAVGMCEGVSEGVECYELSAVFDSFVQALFSDGAEECFGYLRYFCAVRGFEY